MDSDDVSALSMDGASAIAGMAHVRRMRKDFAKMQIGIPEVDEEEGQHADEGRSGRHSSGPLQEDFGTSGEELIEPFPKTFEEWQRKKEKRQKKSKKEKKEKKHKKSGKGSRSSGKREQAQDAQSMEGLKAPPIMEISIQSANIDDGDESQSQQDRHSGSGHGHENSSDVRSYTPSMAESTASTSLVSGLGTSSKSLSRRHSNFTNDSGGAMGKAVKRSMQHRSSLRSMEHRSSSVLSAKSGDSHGEFTHMTGHSTHMTGHSSMSHSQSHVTIEDLNQLRANLERARAEENKVVEIHQRLLREVQLATEKSDRANDRRRTVSLELESVSIERADYQRQLALLHEENARLKKKLRRLEEKESERGLDDVLDSMEAKIRALKKQGQKSREKKEQKRRASLQD